MSVMLTLDVPRQKGVKVERQYWNEMVTRIRARDTVTITEEAECCLIVLNYGQASLLDLETGQTVMIELLPDGEAKAEITGGTGNDFPTLKHLIVGPCYDLRSYLFHIFGGDYVLVVFDILLAASGLARSDAPDWTSRWPSKLSVPELSFVTV